MDVTTLYNLALDKIGARNKIALPSEQSREAEACNLWYPNIRDQILASAPWPEATKMARLALLSTQEDDSWSVGNPRPDLQNSYALPADLLRPQYISNYESFSIQSFDSENRALMTNAASPVLVYTFRQTLLSMMSPDLQMAIMHGLAASICMSLTGKTSRVKLLIDQANSVIISAREAAANTDNEMFDSVPDWITARGYSGGITSPRFFYPFGGLLTANVS